MALTAERSQNITARPKLQDPALKPTAAPSDRARNLGICAPPQAGITVSNSRKNDSQYTVDN